MDQHPVFGKGQRESLDVVFRLHHRVVAPTLILERARTEQDRTPHAAIQVKWRSRCGAGCPGESSATMPQEPQKERRLGTHKPCLFAVDGAG